MERGKSTTTLKVHLLQGCFPVINESCKTRFLQVAAAMDCAGSWVSSYLSRAESTGGMWRDLSQLGGWFRESVEELTGIAISDSHGFGCDRAEPKERGTAVVRREPLRIQWGTGLFQGHDNSGSVGVRRR